MIDSCPAVKELVDAHLTVLSRKITQERSSRWLDRMTVYVNLRYMLEKIEDAIKKETLIKNEIVDNIINKIKYFRQHIENEYHFELVDDDNNTHPIPSDDDEQGPMPAVDDIGHRHGEPGGLKWIEEKQFWMAMDKLLNIISS